MGKPHLIYNIHRNGVAKRRREVELENQRKNYLRDGCRHCCWHPPRLQKPHDATARAIPSSAPTMRVAPTRRPCRRVRTARVWISRIVPDDGNVEGAHR